TLGEIELTVVHERVVEAIANALVIVDASDREGVLLRDDSRGGVLIDRGAQHHPSTLVAVGRHVGASATEADAKWRAGANQHGTTLPICSKMASITRAVSTISRYGIG